MADTPVTSKATDVITVSLPKLAVADTPEGAATAFKSVATDSLPTLAVADTPVTETSISAPCVPKEEKESSANATAPKNI